MLETPLSFSYESNYLFYILDGMVKMLLTWGQLAWLYISNHQRLNVEHPSIINYTTNTSQTKNINLTKQTLTQNKELFYQWLVGFTDGDGTFSIAHQNGKWSLAFKLSQQEYNIRLLYFISSQLGVGIINKETKTKMVNYRIRDRNKLAEIIFPIFDKYLLLTSKYFNYLNFKEAYKILENNNLTKAQKDELMLALIKKVPSLDYVSPAWGIVNNIVSNTNEAKTVMSKAWLIGFTEAEGSFYLVNKSKDRIVHGFEITQKLDLIVLIAIGKILGIKTTSKKTSKPYGIVVTTNSRSIENIIKYYKNTMKGMKSFEFRVWQRCYVKHKGDFIKLNEIRNKIRSKNLNTTLLNYKTSVLASGFGLGQRFVNKNSRLIHTSPINYTNKKFNIVLDNSNKDFIINRKNGIYKIYENLFLNTGNVINHYDINNKLIDNFTLNLVEILEDLYDNNKATIPVPHHLETELSGGEVGLNLYFIVKPDLNRFIKFDIEGINQHFAKYPVEFIDQNMVKFYKNTGLLTAASVFVFYSFYDIENLTQISLNLKKHIIYNIEIINDNVHKDLNNTRINYTNKFDIDSEIMLIIHADFDKIKLNK